MPPQSNKTPTTAGKAPAATDNELISQDPDAVLAALEKVIVESTHEFARPLAPAITSISIALRDLQDDALTVDQEVNVRVYMPFNADNNGASYRRVEGELYNLQPEEMESFGRLVDDVRAERGDGGGPGRETRQNRANDKNNRGEPFKLRELRKIAADQDVELVKARARISELLREVEQRDDESEFNEKRTTELERLRGKLDQANVDLSKEEARNAALKEELMMYRRDPNKRPLASLKNRDDDGDAVARGTGNRGTDDAKDDEPTFDHADDLASSVTDAKATKKPGSHASSKKPRPSMPPFTPAPKATRSESNATDQSKTSKKPERIDHRESGSGAFGNGDEPHHGPSWGINKAHKPKHVQQSEADVNSDEDFAKPVEPVSKKKRKTETSDGEEQPATSKKPRQAPKLKAVEEELDGEDKQAHAVKGSRASAPSKARLSPAEQSAKRNVAQYDSAESEGSLSDPTYISSGEDANSDTEDED